MKSRWIVTASVSVCALFNGHALGDSPYPSVSQKCLAAEDKLIVSVSAIDIGERNLELLQIDPYEAKTVEQTCKLSSGTFRTVMKYSLVEKCGLMSVDIRIYRGKQFLARREVEYCYDVHGDDEVHITVLGRTGKVMIK